MAYQMGDFQLDKRMMRYSLFVPRFYNLCKSYGFEPGRIMPSRAFCSDENQGYPIILIAKHFGIFPFNHGRVGGIVATGRHAPHSHHGKDLVIVQASHVGYDPETGRFGAYRRLKLDGEPFASCCGKISGIMSWYEEEYNFACENVTFTRLDTGDVVVIDNQLLDREREAGLFLNLEQLIDIEPDRRPDPLRVFSTSKAFRVHPDFKGKLPASFWKGDRQQPIGEWLTADLFHFKRDNSAAREGLDQLERNLIGKMPSILTSPFPALVAAQINTQIEFDRTYRSIFKEPGYKGKNLAFIAGINIDISPHAGQQFPLTKFVPWAAYIQTRKGQKVTLEQQELSEKLFAQSSENSEKIDLTRAIHTMEDTPEVYVKIDMEGTP